MPVSMPVPMPSPYKVQQYFHAEGLLPPIDQSFTASGSSSESGDNSVDSSSSTQASASTARRQRRQRAAVAAAEACSQSHSSSSSKCDWCARSCFCDSALVGGSACSLVAWMMIMCCSSVGTPTAADQ